MATEPDSIAICLGDDLTRIERIGLEAGPLSEWLVRELSVLGIVVTLLETRQVDDLSIDHGQKHDPPLTRHARSDLNPHPL